MSRIVEKAGFNIVAKDTIADEVSLDEWVVFKTTGDVPDVEVCVASPHVGDVSWKRSYHGKNRAMSRYRSRIKMPAFLVVRLAAGQTA
jgi:hypothetical protein